MGAKKKALKKQVDEGKLTDWAKRGQALAKAKNGNQWAIGDWILKGAEDFGTKVAYNRAQKATGMTRATLQVFKYTAECFRVLTRVKNLSFGHHRLVAKKKTKSEDGIESGFTPNERKKLLQTARKHKWPVAKFAAYLKSRAKKVEQQENTPTTADAAAKKIVEQCQHLRDHSNLRALFKNDPPKDYERRKQVVDELRATAEDAATA